MSDQHVLGKVKERVDCKARDSQLGILNALPLQLPLGKACFHVAGVDERPVQGDTILQEPALPSQQDLSWQTRFSGTPGTSCKGIKYLPSSDA